MFIPRDPVRAAGRAASRSGMLPVRQMLPAACEALSEVAFLLRQTTRILNTAHLVVLLVDDDPYEQLLGCALLSHWGVMPQLASDGHDAVGMADEQNFDIILMDVDMPQMDGLSATAEIRRREHLRQTIRQVPVVAHTAGNLALNFGRWQACGMDAVLPNPCGAQEMGQCLQQWCLSPTRAIRH